MSLLTVFLVDETGQDLVEYALLTSAIGFAGAVAFSLLASSINTVYSGWDGGVNGLWEVPTPQS
jgi:Flp pilus assembly pilin Flp